MTSDDKNMPNVIGLRGPVPKLMSVEMAAARTGTSEASIRKMVKSREIEVEWHGKSYLVPKEQLHVIVWLADRNMARRMANLNNQPKLRNVDRKIKPEELLP